MPESEQKSARKSRPAPGGEPDAALSRLLDHTDLALAASLKRLFALLRFRSVGTDPAYNDQCRKAAEWLSRDFASLGFSTEIVPTTGQPVVLATSAPQRGSPKLPHVLFYGHYDVQPSDPDELWTSPPFAPEIRRHANGREAIFARGAVDDKGQLMTFVEAVRSWKACHGALPFRLTLLIEGDEEGDNSHLDRFVAANRKRLKADIAWICDTGLWDARTPAIITALRGCIAEEVFIHGPRIDLHSGLYGGPAMNPARALSEVIASLHDRNGRVTIAGFYDGIRKPSAAERQRLASIPFNSAKFMKSAGLRHPAGETGYSVLEQTWVRPTCEVNGILGGYTGPGGKTVLPAMASAKFTFRLVEGQDPRAIRRAFHAHVRAKLPPDCKVTFDSSGGDSGGVRVNAESPWVAMASRALQQEWGRPPVMAMEGGSIPVVESFRKHLGLDSLLMGFGLNDDAVHSPDEKYDIRSFHKGIRSWARLIAAVHERNMTQ